MEPRGFPGRAFRVVLTVALVAAVLVALPASPASAEMCPPTTLEDLFPDEPPATDDAEDTEPLADEAAPPPAPEPEPACTPYVRKIHSPVPYWISAASSFGADRDGGARHHAGNDIAAPRLTPILAVANGRVSRINAERTSMRIVHSDGWSSSYVHLNNDTWGTDDGLRTTGVVPGLEVGDPVIAGQVIAYMGDSTNAEETIPHLHWELRTPGGVPIDPWASYKAAWGRQDPFDGPFRDDDGHLAEDFIGLATSLGAVLACDDVGVEVCADEPITPERAEWLVEALTGFPIATPVAPLEQQVHLDVTGASLPVPTNEDPTPKPPTIDQFVEMLDTAAERQAAADRLAAAHAAESTTTTTEPATTTTLPPEPEHLLSVGCLWEPPTGDEIITTADAIVVALVETGWAGHPECDFVPTTTTEAP